MAAFDRLLTSSYWHSILTMALSGPVLLTNNHTRLIQCHGYLLIN